MLFTIVGYLVGWLGANLTLARACRESSLVMWGKR